MTTTAIAGPFVVFGELPQIGGLGIEQAYNPNAGPSIFYQGIGILDPRVPFTYYPGQAGGKTTAWFGNGPIMVYDGVPAVAAVGAIVAGAPITANTAMTLVSSSGAGIVVGQSTVNALTGAAVTGLLAMGTAMGTVAFGSSGGNIFWDPTKALARGIAVTAGGGATVTGTITFRGYDLFGYPMTETITPVAGSQVAGKKAWKYIASGTPSYTDAGANYSVDTIDLYGFNLATTSWAYVLAYSGSPATPANNLVTAATSFVGAVATTATAITGDVRGTVGSTVLTADGTKKLTLYVNPQVNTIGASTAGIAGTGYAGQNYPSGLFGVQQF